MTRFDDVIETALATLRETLGQLPRIHFVRDVSGALVVILPEDAIEKEQWGPLGKRLDEALRPYSPGERRVLIAESDVLDPDDVFSSPDKVPVSGESDIWLIDRLITNQDWLRGPIFAKPPVPTLVAFSVKGGVGRSTALSMLSWYLADQGKNVLVVDLDLEAPGIGALLLSAQPTYGLVDWLVESINDVDGGDLLLDSIGESPISSDSQGRVRVLPAYGSETRNYIAKLGRIYASTFDENGALIGLAERLSKLLIAIDGLQDRPDVVLLDARAGLHDIGSAAVTRLGAEVLLFARNDEQNWWAYKQLFEHLKRAKSVAHGMGADSDLRWRLKMVAAQTEPREDAKREWINASYAVWNMFYDDETAQSEGFEPQVFDRSSVEAPHYPTYINYDPGVRSLVLNEAAAKPDWQYVLGVYGDFFAGAEQRLWPAGIQHEEIE